MKKSILIAAILLVSGCGTVHKVTEKLKTERDSIVNTKRDSLSVAKHDSVGHNEDHSLIKTTEHIVNDIEQPGDTLSGAAKFDALLNHSEIIASADSSETIELSYNKKDSSVVATVKQKPKKVHQTIDRTTENQRNATQDYKVTNSDKTKTNAKQGTNVHVDTVHKSSEKTKTGLVIPWYIYACAGAIILIGLGLFIAYKYAKKTL